MKELNTLQYLTIYKTVCCVYIWRIIIWLYHHGALGRNKFREFFVYIDAGILRVTNDLSNSNLS